MTDQEKAIWNAAFGAAYVDLLARGSWGSAKIAGERADDCVRAFRELRHEEDTNVGEVVE